MEKVPAMLQDQNEPSYANELRSVPEILFNGIFL